MAEFQYRINRRFDLQAILPRLLRAAVLTMPQPLRILRLSAVSKKSGGILKVPYILIMCEKHKGNTMAKITDLTIYRNKADLGLCLDLIEDACASLKIGFPDLAESQLHNILETFKEDQLEEEECQYNAKILHYSSH